MLAILVKTIVNTNNNTMAIKFCWYQYQYCCLKVLQKCEYQYWYFSWLSTSSAKLMLISVELPNGIIMAILNCCLKFSVIWISNSLEVRHIAPTGFTSYSWLWSLCPWSSMPLTVLLLFPTAFVTLINAHLFYYVYLIGCINCLCCWSCFCSLFEIFVCLKFFTNNNIVIYIFTQCTVFVTLSVCHFPCAFLVSDCQEIKRLLT